MSIKQIKSMVSSSYVHVPIMLGYFKRVEERSEDATDGDAVRKSKRPCTAQAVSIEGGGSSASPREGKGRDPLTIVTWNANGLGVRLNKDWRELKDFLVRVMPDVCCIQEVRYAAAGLPKCKKDDDRGRKRGQLKADTTADRKDKELLQDTLKSLAGRLGYRLVMSLANYKYAGTAALIRNTCPATRIFYNVTSEGLSKEHHPEGRVIALEYASFTLVNFYVPNNGVKEDSFCRREEWDANVRAFVNGYDRPLILSGDLNVAHEDADLTHPAFFKRMCPAVEPMNSGQPGCTPAEKRRHAQLLESGGGLIDAYRHLHPAPENDGRRYRGDGGGTDTEGITWRGTAGNDVAEMGRFYGKGMRIDYFLLSTVLAPQIAGVKVFGRGKDREGFLGSDHSPVMLTLGGVGQRDSPSGSGGTVFSGGSGEMQEGVGGVEGGKEVGDAGGGRA